MTALLGNDKVWSYVRVKGSGSMDSHAIIKVRGPRHENKTQNQNAVVRELGRTYASETRELS